MHWAGLLLLAVPAAALLPGYIPLSRAAAGCSAEARTRAEAALARLADEAAGMAEQLAGRAETTCRAGLERAGPGRARAGRSGPERVGAGWSGPELAENV